MPAFEAGFPSSPLDLSGREESARLPPCSLCGAHAREQPGLFCCFAGCSRSPCRSFLWLLNPEEPELWGRGSPH